MKKLALVLMFGLVAVPCLADNSKVELRATVDDGENIISSSGLITKYFPSGAVQQQYISIDGNTNTTITVPTGAKAFLIDTMTADGIQLKGAAGDVGISLDNFTPILVPLSGDSTVVINSLEKNGNRIKVYWL